VKRVVFNYCIMAFMMILVMASVQAQTPTPTTTSAAPPHIDVVKMVMNPPGEEICPGFTIDVSVTLTGSGMAIRLPVDAVTVIDRSGSMNWGAQAGWNSAIEPPYGPPGVPPYTVET